MLLESNYFPLLTYHITLTYYFDVIRLRLLHRKNLYSKNREVIVNVAAVTGVVVMVVTTAAVVMVTLAPLDSEFSWSITVP